jgi:hypothetical protein
MPCATNKQPIGLLAQLVPQLSSLVGLDSRLLTASASVENSFAHKPSQQGLPSALEFSLAGSGFAELQFSTLA